MDNEPTYIERTYRNLSTNSHWHYFAAKYKEIDLWVGVPRQSFQATMPNYVNTLIAQQRSLLDRYLSRDKAYIQSLVPYQAMSTAPLLLRKMSAVSVKTGIGPMSAVAGAFSLFVGESLCAHFDLEEVIVENGGDVYAHTPNSLDIPVFAGRSPLSEKVGLQIPNAQEGLGICTSAGTVGPSLSFGKADAVMIVCRDVLLADSYATRFANAIKVAEDIPRVLEQIQSKPEILGALIIKDDKMGVTGQFELKLF